MATGNLLVSKIECGQGASQPLVIQTGDGETLLQCSEGGMILDTDDNDVYTPPPQDDDPPPPPPPPPDEDIPIRDSYVAQHPTPFSMFFSVDMATTGGVIAGEKSSSSKILDEQGRELIFFKFSVKDSAGGTRFTLADLKQSWDIDIPEHFDGLICGLLRWKEDNRIELTVWSDGIRATETVDGSDGTYFADYNITRSPGDAEEIEVEHGSQTEDSDYWETCQYFYTQGGVEFSPVKCNMEPNNCRHDLFSPKVVLHIAVDAKGAYHKHIAPEIKLLSDRVIWADASYHDLVSSEPMVGVTIDVEGAYHSHHSEEPELCNGLVLQPDDCYHEHIAEKVPFEIPDIIPDNCFHEILNYDDVKIVETATIKPDSTRHTHTADGEMFIGVDGNAIYADDCYHEVKSDEIPAMTVRKAVRGLRNCFHTLVSDEVGEFQINYHIIANDTVHKQIAEVVTPTMIYADDCVHITKTGSPWKWTDDTEHLQISGTPALIVSIDVFGCKHSFVPTANPRLTLSVIARDCYHTLLTKDVLEQVHSSSHDLISPEIVGNAKYRRYYV